LGGRAGVSRTDIVRIVARTGLRTQTTTSHDGPALRFALVDPTRFRSSPRCDRRGPGAAFDSFHCRVRLSRSLPSRANPLLHS
jgi:hypothetical protein